MSNFLRTFFLKACALTSCLLMLILYCGRTTPELSNNTFREMDTWFVRCSVMIQANCTRISLDYVAASLAPRPLFDSYECVLIHWARVMRHYLTECWNNVNWTLRIKLQWLFLSKFINFHLRKCIWKRRMQNNCYFVSASMSNWVTRIHLNLKSIKQNTP